MLERRFADVDPVIIDAVFAEKDFDFVSTVQHLKTLQTRARSRRQLPLRTDCCASRALLPTHTRRPGARDQDRGGGGCCGRARGGARECSARRASASALVEPG